ncbi:starch-binding domain-containing protein 1 [Sorex araneus]|uniref:starch-binding domain-containing protein 1 n=1 Tax=Sorex araneus TaxID=42254 RepID=UPI00243364FC|nr:starch-binding domain-containing protein 1 [Sorex araneus]
MGAVWSALLVGGGLAGALVVWLLRGPGDPGRAEMEQDAPPAEAAEPGGGDPRSPGPCRRQLDSKTDPLQGGSERLGSEPQGSGKGGASQLQSPSGEDCEGSRAHVPSGRAPDTDSLVHEVGNARSFLDSSRGERGFLKGQDAATTAAPCFVEKLPSVDRAAAAGLARLDSQELADAEDWEVVSRHSSWGEIGLGGSLEAFVVSPNEGLDDGRDIFVEVKDQAEEVKTDRAVAVPPGPERVSIRFQIHYIPSTDMQALAVTGDHESLGKWNTYVPLQAGQEGLWSQSVSLPADTGVEWKFVVVENGRITRWEECSNRFLETGFEDKVVHKWWGTH